MARMDNAYRLTMGALKSRMIPLAVIEAETGRHVSEIEAAVAREENPRLNPETRKQILDSISRRLPVSVEDIFLNADRLRQSYPRAFDNVAIGASNTSEGVKDIPTQAASDFIEMVKGCSINSAAEIQRIEDKARAIAAAQESALNMRLQAGNQIDSLLSGPGITKMSWNQKVMFLWVSCYAKAQKLELKDAFKDIFNSLGATDKTLLTQVSFCESFFNPPRRMDFSTFVINTCG